LCPVFRRSVASFLFPFVVLEIRYRSTRSLLPFPTGSSRTGDLAVFACDRRSSSNGSVVPYERNDFDDLRYGQTSAVLLFFPGKLAFFQIGQRGFPVPPFPFPRRFILMLFSLKERPPLIFTSSGQRSPSFPVTEVT